MSTKREWQAAKRRYLRTGSGVLRKVACEHEGCGREIGVYTPKNGDGALDYYRRHNMPNGEPCPLSCRPVPSQDRMFRSY